MTHNEILEEIVGRICALIDYTSTSQEDKSESGFQLAKSKSENKKRMRDADDDTYKEYIRSLLADMLDENDDYLAENQELYYISPQDKAVVVERVFGMYRGLGMLDTILMDESITEVMINGPKNIFVERNGRVERLNMQFGKKKENSDKKDNNEDKDQEDDGALELKKIIHRIVDISGREVNQSKPIVDARLKDGSRVNIVLHPIAMNGDTVTIRKFSKKPMSVEKLIEYGSITQEIADKLQCLVKARYNIFISGGTGSGKTTFLNAMSNYIPHDERVITIEDSAELQITRVDNLVSLETKNANTSGEGAITIKDLIKSSLRMRPDRIVVGEVRGEEALDMLQAMNTGHDGSLSTGHANSAKDMLSRLETMVLQGAAALPLDAVRQQIASAIDLIIHLSRLRDHSRKVVEIVEVLDYKDGQILLNPLYKFEEDEQSTVEKVHGSLNRTSNPMINSEKLQLAGIRMEF